jgi:hypothetical protein
MSSPHPDAASVALTVDWDHGRLETMEFSFQKLQSSSFSPEL